MPDVVAFRAPLRYPQGYYTAKGIGIGLEGLSQALFTYAQRKDAEEERQFTGISWVMEHYGPDAVGQGGLEKIDKYFTKRFKMPLPRDDDNNLKPPNPTQSQLISSWIQDLQKNHPEALEKIKNDAIAKSYGLRPPSDIEAARSIQERKDAAALERTRVSSGARLLSAELVAGSKKADDPSGYGEVNGKILPITEARQIDPGVKELPAKVAISRFGVERARLLDEEAQHKADAATNDIQKEIKDIPVILNGLKMIKEGKIPREYANDMKQWIIADWEERTHRKHTEAEKEAWWKGMLGWSATQPANAAVSPDLRSQGQEFLKQVGPQVPKLIQQGLSPDEVLTMAGQEGEKYGMRQEYLSEAAKAIQILGPAAFKKNQPGPATGTVTAPTP